MSRQRVIFCDFDGTITENDNIVAIMRHFDPEGANPIIEDVLAKRISVREGVGRMFALLPASRKQEIVDYAISNAKIRQGFGDLLKLCEQEDIQFWVTSGGIDFFVYPLLAPFAIPHDHIFCNGSDFSGDRIRILWPHACDEHCTNDCGMCKTAIIRRYPKEQYERILIGDSVTDFEGSKLADVVFARSHLIQLCEDLKLNYKPFETFHDVIRGLEEMKVK